MKTSAETTLREEAAEGLSEHAESRQRHTSTAAFAVPRVLLIAMLLTAPLAFGAVQVWAWSTLCILACILLFLWALACFRQRRISIAWSPLYLPALGFFLIGAIQLAGGRAMDPYGAREAILDLATDFIVFFMALQLWSRSTLFAFPAEDSGKDQPDGSVDAPFSSRRHGSARQWHGAWNVLGLATTIYSFLLALLAILQFFSAHGLIYWRVKTDGWVFGPYVNHNDYAGLMEMLIPVSLMYIFSRRRSGGASSLLGFMALFPVASVLLSGSRGGCIALLVEFIILAAVLMGRRAREERRRYAMAALLGILLVSALAVWLGSGKIATRLATIAGLAHSPQVTLGQRLTVSHDALGMLRNHLWLGTGVGSFGVVYPQYQSFATDAVFYHAHNDYMEALAESGVFGGLLIALAIAVFFRSAFRNLGARLRTNAGWIQSGAVVGCCGILIHSLADFNLHIPANALWFAFLLGLSQAALWPEKIRAAEQYELSC